MVSSLLRRTRLLAAGTALLVLGGVASVAVSTPSSARMMLHPAIDGVGSVSCNVAGHIMFNPALTVGGVMPTTVTLRAVLTGCTGTGDGVNVVRGLAVVQGQSPTNDCLSLRQPPSGPRSGPLHWTTARGTQRLNPSMIEFDGGSYSVGPPISVDATGTSTAGSFTGDNATSHTVLKETFDRLATLCYSMHGLKAVHFTVGSTFAVATPN